MRYLDFDLEIGPASGDGYPVTARSEAGQVRQPMRLPFDEQALEKQMLKLQIALLQASADIRQLSSEQQLVEDFGKQLFNTLISGEVRNRFDVCREIATRQKEETGVRLRLQLQAPELVALPWEFLYDSRKGEYICLSRSTPLVRYLALEQPIQRLTVNPPLRILGMIAAPSDQPRLSIPDEKQRIAEALQTLKEQGLVELHWLEGQTWNDLQQALWEKNGPWHIFHFIGHGGFDPDEQEGMLALANEKGTTHLLGAAHLARFLADHRSLRLVLLNACEGARSSEKNLFSSIAATLARYSIPAVLAMQYAITDRAAIQLTRTFYQAVAHELPIDEALSEARKAISANAPKSLEWGVPVLYLCSPDGVLFNVPKDALLPAAPAPATKACIHCGSLLPSTATFCGICGLRQSTLDKPATPQPTDIPEPTPPKLPRRVLSRRAVVAGLVGLAAAGLAAAGGGITWLLNTSHHPIGTTLETYHGHTLGVIALVWLSDGSRVASASADTTVQVWDATSARHLFTYSRHTGQVNAIARSGTRLASASADMTVQVWDATSGNYLFTYPGYAENRKQAYTVSWSPTDATLIASGGSDQAVRVWEATTGTTRPPYPGRADVFAVAWSPDGKYIAVGSSDPVVQVWDTTSGSADPIFTYQGHSKGVKALAWSPDGLRIASGSYDATVQIWDALTGGHPRFYQGHKATVRAVAWAGNRIVSAGDDKTAQIWDANSGTHLFTYQGHTNEVFAAAWSPDGTRIASGGKDKIVQVWQAE